MKIFIISLLASILSGLFYRTGGSDKFPSWVRDWLVSPILCLVLAFLGLVVGLWGWLALVLTLGLTGAAISSYHYFLPKPDHYNGFWYALHGLVIGLAAFPVALVTHHWIGWGIRCLCLPIFMGVWYGAMKRNDFWHEFGRGAAILASAPLLLI
jgi:hypothetical protein